MRFCKLTHLIDGQEFAGSVDSYSLVVNPKTNAKVAEVAIAGVLECEAAVEGATRSFKFWKALSPGERLRILDYYYELIANELSDLVRLTVEDTASDSATESDSIHRGLWGLEVARYILKRSGGASGIEKHVGFELPYSQPIGIGVGIVPDLHPVMHALWASSVALAWGNTFILCPTTEAPRACWRLVELFHEAGGSTGALGLINGGYNTAFTLVATRGVGAVSAFTKPELVDEILTFSIGQGNVTRATGTNRTTWLKCPPNILYYPWKC